MVHRGPRRLGAAFRFLQPPPPRSPAPQNAKLPPAGAPPPADPAPLHLRAAPPGPGDPAAGGPGRRSAASGAGRTRAARAGAHPGAGAGAGAERAREGARAARRAALVQRGEPKYQFQTLGKHSAPRTAHAPRYPHRPLPAGPAPAALTPLTGRAARGCGFVCHFGWGGGRGDREGGRGANFTRSFVLGGRACRAALHEGRGTRGGGCTRRRPGRNRPSRRTAGSLRCRRQSHQLPSPQSAPSSPGPRRSGGISKVQNRLATPTANPLAALTSVTQSGRREGGPKAEKASRAQTTRNRGRRQREGAGLAGRKYWRMCICTARAASGPRGRRPTIRRPDHLSRQPRRLRRLRGPHCPPFVSSDRSQCRAAWRQRSCVPAKGGSPDPFPPVPWDPLLKSSPPLGETTQAGACPGVPLCALPASLPLPLFLSPP